MTYPQTVTPTQAGTWDLCSSAAVPASGHPSPPATNTKKLREATRDWVHETTHDWVHGHLKQILGKRYKQAKTQLPVVKSLEQKHAPCTRHLLRGGHNT